MREREEVACATVQMSRSVNIFAEPVLSSHFYMRVLKAELRLPGLPGKVSLSLSNLANLQEKNKQAKTNKKKKQNHYDPDQQQHKNLLIHPKTKCFRNRGSIPSGKGLMGRNFN